MTNLPPNPPPLNSNRPTYSWGINNIYEFQFNWYFNGVKYKEFPLDYIMEYLIPKSEIPYHWFDLELIQRYKSDYSIKAKFNFRALGAMYIDEYGHYRAMVSIDDLDNKHTSIAISYSFRHSYKIPAKIKELLIYKFIW